MNTTDKDLEEAINLIDPHFAESTKDWENLGGEFARGKEMRARKIEQAAGEIARIRAEAKAEALREAAERVEKYMDGTHPPHYYSVGVHNALMGYSDILADEPRTCETCGTPYCDQYKRGGSCPNYSPRDVSADITAADRVLAWIKAELGWSLGDPDTGELGPEGIETRNRLASVIGFRHVSAEDVETVREYVLSTIGSHHKPRERDILAALDRIVGKEEPRHD